MIEITQTHPEHKLRLPEWDMCHDCNVGESSIKGKREVYLPKLERHDDTREGKARYNDYLQRATFFGVVSIFLATDMISTLHSCYLYYLILVL